MSKATTISLVLFIVAGVVALYVYIDEPSMFRFGAQDNAGFNAAYAMRITQADADFEYLNSNYNAEATYQLGNEEKGRALERLSKELVSQGYVTDIGSYNVQVIGLKIGTKRLIYAHAWCQEIDTGDRDLKKTLITKMVSDGYRCFLDMTLDESGKVTIKPHAYG